MKKVILVSVNTKTLNINVSTFDTHEDAHAKMETEYNNFCYDEPIDEGIYNDSAYIKTFDYDIIWEIKEIE